MAEGDPAPAAKKRTTQQKDTGPRKKQRASKDAAAAGARSRTTEWRNQTGKTKKARAIAFQPSIASLSSFQAKSSSTSLPAEETNSPSPALCNPTAPSIDTHTSHVHVISDDSDCELIDSFEPTTVRDPLLDEPMSSVAIESAESTSCIEIIQPESENPVDPEFMSRCEEAASPVFATEELGEDGGGESRESEGPEGEQAESLTDAEDEADVADTVHGTAAEFHDELALALKKLEKRLRAPKKLLSDKKAAGQLPDVELLKQYNKRRFELSSQQASIRDQIQKACPTMRHKLKQRLARIKPALSASTSVASRAGKTTHYARRLRSMALHVLRTGELPEDKQGKGGSHATQFEQPEIKKRLEEWKRREIPKEKGGLDGRPKPQAMRTFVKKHLFPELGIDNEISESTAVRWFKKLGFRGRRYKKGIYYDGHERDDVVKRRQEFVYYMFTMVLPHCVEYNGDLADIEAWPLLCKDQIWYPIFHDESTVHANDQALFVWELEDEHELRKKDRGRVVHVSDFIIEECGRLFLSEEEIVREKLLPKRPLSPQEIAALATVKEAAVQAAASAQGKAYKKVAKKAAAMGLRREKALAEHKRLPKLRKTNKLPSPTQTAEANLKPAPQVVATNRTVEGLDWSPPPPPLPHTRYRCDSFDARRIIYPGSGHDPWWDMPQLIAQTKDTIDIFEAKFPKGKAVFIFDCSSAHEAFASDALLAHKMNLGPGGAQPKMHKTTIPSTGEEQLMVWPEDYSGVDKDGASLAGQPKGLEQVLRERGLLEKLKASDGLRKVCAECKKSDKKRTEESKLAKSREQAGEVCIDITEDEELEDEDEGRRDDCCMQRLLSQQEDFRAEKPLLQVLIERRGHICLFLPKFHCELNPIEMYWAQFKRRFRELADGTFPTAKRLVPECLDAISVKNIRRYFSHCYRYMSAYKHGLSMKQAVYAVKKYTSHRKIPARVLMDIQTLSN